MIIGIAGRTGVGKDTLALAIKQVGIESYGIEWEIRRFSAVTKSIVARMLGISEELMEDRGIKEMLLADALRKNAAEIKQGRELLLSSMALDKVLELKFYKYNTVKGLLNDFYKLMESEFDQNILILNELIYLRENENKNIIYTDIRDHQKIELIKDLKGLNIMVSRNNVPKLKMENMVDFLAVDMYIVDKKLEDLDLVARTINIAASTTNEYDNKSKI